MNFLNNLAHGEIVVLSGILAVTMFAAASVIGAVVAFLATREPVRSPRAVADKAHPVPAGMRSPLPTAG